MNLSFINSGPAQCRSTNSVNHKLKVELHLRWLTINKTDLKLLNALYFFSSEAVWWTIHLSYFLVQLRYCSASEPNKDISWGRSLEDRKSSIKPPGGFFNFGHSRVLIREGGIFKRWYQKDIHDSCIRLYLTFFGFNIQFYKSNAYDQQSLSQTKSKLTCKNLWAKWINKTIDNCRRGLIERGLV